MIVLELVIVGCAILAVVGYLRANSLNTKELNEEEEKKNLYGSNSETALGERV